MITITIRCEKENTWFLTFIYNESRNITSSCSPSTSAQGCARPALGGRIAKGHARYRPRLAPPCEKIGISTRALYRQQSIKHAHSYLL